MKYESGVDREATSWLSTACRKHLRNVHHLQLHGLIRWDARERRLGEGQGVYAEAVQVGVAKKAGAHAHI